MAVAMETIDTAQKWESNIVMRDEEGPTPCTPNMQASALTCFSASGWTTYLLTAAGFFTATTHTSCEVKVTLAVAAIY